MIGVCTEMITYFIRPQTYYEQVVKHVQINSLLYTHLDSKHVLQGVFPSVLAKVVMHAASRAECSFNTSSGCRANKKLPSHLIHDRKSCSLAIPQHHNINIKGQ